MIDAAGRFPRREAALSASLGAAAVETRRIGPGAFAFRLHGAEDLDGRATLEDEWARLELHGAVRALPSVVELIARNAGLPGPAKWAWPHGARAPSLLVDCWFDDGGPAAHKEVLAGCASLAAALAQCEGRVPEVSVAPGSQEGRDLHGELRAVGWKLNRRADGSVAVDLETGPDFFQAHVGGDSGWPRCHADVAASDDIEVDADEALAWLLLSASATLRLVRGASIVADNRRFHRFEVGLAAGADPAALDRALSALSVACAVYGPTARVLRQPAIARTYAAVRGWSRTVETTQGG